MNAKEFADLFRKRIGLHAFDYESFTARSDIVIVETTVTAPDLAGFCCPWYTDGVRLLKYREAMSNPSARCVRVPESGLIDKNIERKETIDRYKRINYVPTPLLLARDLATGRTLILDGNKRTVAFYRKHSGKPEATAATLSAIVITGRNLENFIGDFQIVNRE